MAALYATVQDIQAAIISIINANPAGVFASNVDTSTSADARFSNEMIAHARRTAAYRIFDAIGANPKHPYWADLSSKVTVASGAKIPTCFGELGIPEILITRRREVTGSFELFKNTNYFVAGYAGAELFTPADEGRFVQLYDASGALLYEREIVDVNDVGIYRRVVFIEEFTDDNTAVRAVILEGREQWITGMEASPDEIDSFAENSYGMYNDPLGDGGWDASSETDFQVRNPLIGKYSTANGYITYTGRSCRIPMIAMPASEPLARQMADHQMPITLVPTNVRLALGLLYKEGDNLAGLASLYSLQGENDLLQIRSGATDMRPIDVTRAIQAAQRYA